MRGLRMLLDFLDVNMGAGRNRTGVDGFAVRCMFHHLSIFNNLQEAELVKRGCFDI